MKESLLETADRQIFRMPLHSDDSGSIDEFDRLSDTCLVSGDHPEPSPEGFDRQGVKSVDSDSLGAQKKAQVAPFLQCYGGPRQDGRDLVDFSVETRKLLVKGAAEVGIQELGTPADPQDGKTFSKGFVQARLLKGVPLSVDTGFITGIASVGERMLILMDIEALMSGSDMGLMDTTTQALQ